ncbi:KAP family P-loop NTPase fold protein [Corallococcus aberystwythensis]|uniref:KAP NTPase domain-containing protein n=1 Tax=Corallococcus aberystwythensis TaxID=2316722 RepID=A0A3A8QWR3_9BACT|nr:P-loop NTPase fold protein [Corallococcus aberystwythensis]RKH73216.1 hypothetical protein D7W81_04300 [Corallococcus aberystwythensis]
MPSKLTSDKPIILPEQDLYNRVSFAEALAQQVSDLEHYESIVIALVGGWGTGKSSTLNLVRNSLERRKLRVLRFNPWLFSGTTQLVSAFFEELAAQFREQGSEKFLNVGKKLDGYGKALAPLRILPIFGTALGEGANTLQATAEIAKRIGGASDSSLEKQKQDLESLLQGVNERIVIVIDDIDRLRGEEIRDVMKLVRLAADLPNMTYILSFDRERVEQALGGAEVSGRAYLEKIVNVTFDIPSIRKSELAGALSRQLKYVLPESFDGENDFHYKAIFRDVLLPLIRTPRDIKRYINALPLRLSIASQEVAISDICAMEAIRIFLPDLFKHLADHVDLLTNVVSPPHSMLAARELETTALLEWIESSLPGPTEKPASPSISTLLIAPAAERILATAHRLFPQRIEKLRLEATSTLSELQTKDLAKKAYLKKLEHAQGRFEALQAYSGFNKKAVETILTLLFPVTTRLLSPPHAFGVYGEGALRSWRRDRRVAHPDVLSFYLETLLPGGVVPHQKFLKTYNKIQDPQSLQNELDSYSSDSFSIFLDRLIDYSREIGHDSIEPLLKVLYHQVNRRLVDADAVPGWSAESKLAELTRDLFHRFDSEEDRDRLATAVLGKVERLSMRSDFIRLVGRAEVGGNMLISEEREHEMWRSLLNEIESWNGEDSAGRNVLAAVELLAKDSILGLRCQQHFSNPFRLLLLLRNSKTDFPSMRGIFPSLPWERMENCLGKEFLRQQITAALQSYSAGLMHGADEIDFELLQLANRYVKGYRDDDNNICSH